MRSYLLQQRHYGENMNVEQMKARIAQIAARLGELEGVENYTDENLTEIKNLNNEFKNLKSTIEAKEAIADVKNAATAGVRKTAPADVSTPAAKVESKDGGFNSFGEFLNAIKKQSTGEHDARFKNAMFEKSLEDGGVLVPDTMIKEVQDLLASDESLLSRTRRFTVSGNSLTLPINEAAPWTGGVRALWTAEGDKIKDSQFKLGQAHFRLHKLAVLVNVSDELLEDSVALESYIREVAPQAIMHTINNAIIAGDGVGKPTGILGSPFKIVVPKESAQAADTIETRNVVNMYSRMIPTSRAKAVWFVNAGLEAALRLMKDDNGNFIFLTAGSQLNQTPYATLLGRPVIPMMGSLPELGTEGDIIFADLSYYYAVTKSYGMKSAVSSHVFFDRDMQSFKFTYRIDGGIPFKKPVTTEFGNYTMSAVITLQDR